MTVFCLNCWHEADSANVVCPYCRGHLDVDARSYEEKLVRGLDHPLPEARVRICWLVRENRIDAAAEKLISMAREDPDLFVQRAAVRALGGLHSERIKPFLKRLLSTSDIWLAADARRSLAEQAEQVREMANHPCEPA